MAATILPAVATAEATEAIFRQLLPVAVMAVDMGGTTVATVVEAMGVAAITLPEVAAVEVPAVIPVVEMEPGTVMAATALPVATTAEHNWAAGNKRQIRKKIKPSSGCLTAIRIKMMTPSWTTRKQAKMMIPGWTTRKQAKQSPMTSNQPGNQTECEPLFPSPE
jgi:hypothetical protein